MCQYNFSFPISSDFVFWFYEIQRKSGWMNVIQWWFWIRRIGQKGQYTHILSILPLILYLFTLIQIMFQYKNHPLRDLLMAYWHVLVVSLRGLWWLHLQVYWRRFLWVQRIRMGFRRVWFQFRRVRQQRACTLRPSRGSCSWNWFLFGLGRVRFRIEIFLLNFLGIVHLLVLVSFGFVNYIFQWYLHKLLLWVGWC